MPDLTFVTGNSLKINIATPAFQKVGVALRQEQLEIDEVQSEDSLYIARKKCQSAFDVVQKPLIINDDSWLMPGLKGFPGPYAKSLNHWLEAADWLRLTSTLTDRQVILSQIVIYQDQAGQQVFTNNIEGTLLAEIKGVSNVPFQCIIAFPDDHGLSIAEALAKDPHAYSKRTSADIYHKVAQWYTQHQESRP